MLIPPSTSFVSHPPRLSTASRRCTHAGGTAECLSRVCECAGCGATPRVCSSQMYLGLARDRWYCETCRDLPACTQCHRTACACTVSVIGAYHQAEPRTLLRSVPRTLSAEPLVGLELEALYPDGTDRLGACTHAIDTIVLSHERDSSLGTDGVESVTVPLPLSVVRHAWPALVSAVAASGGSADYPACGAHIHVTATPEMKAGADRIYATYGTPSQLPVWDAVCGRLTTAYTSNGWHRRPDLPGSRACLWRTPFGTIEWRHPGGTDDPRVLVGRAELIVDALRHAAALPPDQAWGWGRYVRDRPAPTPNTAYAWALLRSIGLYR